MKSRTNLKRAVAAVAVGVIIGGGVTVVTPAGAEVSQFAATNWKKIWKKKLQPLADKRYYKKSASDAKYSTKAETSAAFANYYTKAQTDAALGGYYTKAQADAKYAAAGSSYTKAEIDAKLAPLVNSVAATAGGNQAVTLTGTEQVVRSISIMPPADGTVIVSSSAYAWASGAGDGGARCSLTTGSTIDFGFLQYVNIPAAAVTESDVISGTRGFAVTKGNLFTANLVCDEFAGNMTLSDSSMTAIFAPS